MSNKTSDRSETSRAKLIGKLRQTISKVGEAAGEAARKGVEIGGQIAGAAAQGTQTAVGKMQRKLGEDYHAILSENPVVLDKVTVLFLTRSPRQHSSPLQSTTTLRPSRLAIIHSPNNAGKA